MNKIPNIKSFSEHGNSINEHIEQVILNESATGASTELENVIVDAAGGDGLKGGVYKHVKPYALANKFKNSVELGEKILSNAGLRKNVGTNAMSGRYSVNKSVWKGRNKTPKTDIFINSKKISLKKGSAQIMSGGSDESLSTFYAALSKMNLDKDIMGISVELTNAQQRISELMGSHVSKQMGGLDIQKYGGTVYHNTKSGKALEKKLAAARTPREKKEIQAKLKALTITTVKKSKSTYGKLNKDALLRTSNAANKELTKSFADLFTLSDKFKREFVFEAMTGQVKFGGNDGAADHFLVVDFKGAAQLHPVLSSGDGYVTTVLGQVSPSVKFKSTAAKKKIDGIDTKTGHYRFWSTVGLMYDAAVKTETNCYDMMNSGELEYLSEGFFDFIKKAWSNFKSFVKNLIAKATNWAKQSAHNMMEYLELQPTVRFNNNVRW